MGAGWGVERGAGYGAGCRAGGGVGCGFNPTPWYWGRGWGWKPSPSMVQGEVRGWVHPAPHHAGSTLASCLPLLIP